MLYDIVRKLPEAPMGRRTAHQPKARRPGGLAGTVRFEVAVPAQGGFSAEAAAHDVVEHVRGRGGRAALSTSAGMASTISMSRSVAVSFSVPLAASIITFERMGIVLRRSTTPLDVAQRLQESAPFDVDFHGSFDCRKVPGKAPSGPLAGPPEALDFLELLKAKELKQESINRP